MTKRLISREQNTESVILIYIIDRDRVTRAELETVLQDDPAEIAAALDQLRDEGVVVLDGDTVSPTRCTRHIYKLGLVGA